jgi:hypothetical protein
LLQEYLSAFRKDEQSRSCLQWCGLTLFRLFTNLIVLGLLAGSGYLMWYLSTTQSLSVMLQTYLISSHMKVIFFSLSEWSGYSEWPGNALVHFGHQCPPPVCFHHSCLFWAISESKSGTYHYHDQVRHVNYWWQSSEELVVLNRLLQQDDFFPELLLWTLLQSGCSSISGSAASIVLSGIQMIKSGSILKWHAIL